MATPVPTPSPLSTCQLHINYSPVDFLLQSRGLIRTQIEREMESQKGLVYWASLDVELEKLDGSETTGHFTHTKKYIYNPGMALEVMEDGYGEIIQRLDTYQEKGSGWIVKRVNHLDLHCSVYCPLRAASYKPLPKDLRNKNAILNIKNNDNKCFAWSILAHLHSRKKTENDNYANYYKPYESELNMTGIDYPVSLNCIDKFELLNDIAVNVYGSSRGILHPLRITKNDGFPNMVHLLLYDGHYSLIRNFNGFLRSQRKYTGGNMHFCHRCLTPKYSREDLEEHLKRCTRPQAVTMPKEKILQFVNIARMLKSPIMIYADFEALTEKIFGPELVREGSEYSLYSITHPL